MENWKRVDWIDGYTGTIEVSDQGRVRRSEMHYTRSDRWGNNATKSTKPARYLTGELGTHGYRLVCVYIGKKRKRFLVHRLIARAFVPGYVEGLSVNHINGNKIDNRPANLEWVTLAENTAKQWQTGLVDLRGEKQPGHCIGQRFTSPMRNRTDATQVYRTSTIPAGRLDVGRSIAPRAAAEPRLSCRSVPINLTAAKNWHDLCRAQRLRWSNACV